MLASRTLASLMMAATLAGCAGSMDGSRAKLSVACPATVPAWSAGSAYAVGDIVSYGGGDYQCRQAHTALADWTPSAVPALWLPVECSSGGGSGGSTGNGGGNGGGGTIGNGGGSCDPNAWVYLGDDENACDGHIGESCGWTSTNLGQGYHCQATSWGTGCEPGGASCPSGGGSGGSGGSGGGGGSAGSGGSGGSAGGGGSGGGGTTGNGNGSLVFSAYKDTSINMNWNTNVITTNVGGSPTAISQDLTGAGGKTITLAFATGECGSENWGGVPGAAMASANVPLLSAAGVKYILSTGGAAGSFTCGSDAGFATFVNRWASSGLIGVDFDIEAGQSQQVISDLVSRIKTAHGAFPNLRFSLTLATLANNNGASTAMSLGSGAPDSFNVYGDETLGAVKSILGFDGSAGTFPSYVTVNLMTMDYGSPSSGVCVVSGGACQMGQSALQAAYNLADHWGVPFANIELTPMIGGNDAQSEQFTLADADTISSFALGKGLAGIHYWSYDRDVDCPPGAASATCNSIGNAGTRGYLKRFLAAGLH